MEQILTAQDNKIDAVVAENDGMAGGVVAALTAQGLQGIPVSGQDGDKAALNRVALVPRPSRSGRTPERLARRQPRSPMQLAKDPDLTTVPGATVFAEGEAGIAMNSILLAPVPILKDNLQASSTPAGSIRPRSAPASPPSGRPRLPLTPDLVKV